MPRLDMTSQSCESDWPMLGSTWQLVRSTETAFQPSTSSLDSRGRWDAGQRPLTGDVEANHHPVNLSSNMQGLPRVCLPSVGV